MCAADVPRTDPRPAWYPFCSERCQLVDLSHWLDGNYAIPDDASSGQ